MPLASHHVACAEHNGKICVNGGRVGPAFIISASNTATLRCTMLPSIGGATPWHRQSRRIARVHGAVRNGLIYVVSGTPGTHIDSGVQQAIDLEAR